MTIKVARKKRKYQALWELIRDSTGGTVTISCSDFYLQRIKKGVFKEKNLDPKTPPGIFLEVTVLSCNPETQWESNTRLSFRLRGRITSQGIEQPIGSIKESYYEQIRRKAASIRKNST